MIQHAYGKVPFDRVVDELPEAARGAPDLEVLKSIRWEDVADQVPYRHPSQLYEGFGEGILLGTILAILYLATRKRPFAPWTYGGVFVFGYGVIRFGIEYFRQPDPQFREAGDDLGTVALGLTMGQLLCSAMVIVGAALIVRGILLGRQDLPPADDPDAAEPGRAGG